jgi:hypothetical protein
MQQLLCKQTVMCVWDRAVSVNALGIILVQNIIGFDAAAGVMTAELRELRSFRYSMWLRWLLSLVPLLFLFLLLFVRQLLWLWLLLLLLLLTCKSVGPQSRLRN